MKTRRLIALLWGVCAAAIITMAILVSAARILLPGMSDYQRQLETLAERYVGRKVSIGSLDAAWHGVSPILKLEQVVIETPQLPGGAFEVDEVHVVLDLLKSLRRLRWATGGFKLVGAELYISTKLNEPSKDLKPGEVLTWLFQQQSIELEKIDVHWSDPLFSNGVLEFTDLYARSENNGNHHKFLLSGLPSWPDTNEITIAGDLRGALSDLAKWRGQLYVKADAISLNELSAFLPETEVMGDIGGNAELELWAGVKEQGLHWVRGEIHVDKLVIEGNEGENSSYHVDKLDSAFHWKYGREVQTLELSNFKLTRREESVWPESDVQLHIQTGDEIRVQGAIEYFSLNESLLISDVLPLSDEDRINLTRLQPTGLLKDLEFHLLMKSGSLVNLSGEAVFDDLGFQPDARKPGVAGLSGHAEGDLNSGSLSLNSHNASLNLPKVFSKALPINYLNGTVEWKKYGDRLRLESRQLAFDIEQIGLTAHWKMDWPYAEEVPWMDLQVTATPLPLVKVADLLPDRIMPVAAVDWLRRAFKSGTAVNGRFLLQGRLDDLPFDRGEGRLEGRFELEDAVLDYHPQWGRLDALYGDAAFVGRSMEITAKSALIHGAPLQRAVVKISDFKKPILDIKGTVGGTLEGMLDYLKSSPLGDRYAKIVDNIDVYEDASLYLDIELPLGASKGDVQVTGGVTLKDNELIIRDQDNSFTRLQGVVDFTQDGVSAKNLRGVFLGQPVVGEVYRQNGTDGQQTVIDIKGALPIVKMLGDKVPALASYISGSTSWNIALSLLSDPQPEQEEIRLQLHSDLHGVVIDLPPPFAKKEDDKREFLASWIPGKEHQQPIQVKIGEYLSANMLLDSDSRELARLGVSIGGQQAVVPEVDGVHVSGFLENININEWARSFPLAAKEDSNQLPLAFDLAIGVISLNEIRIRDIQISGSVVDHWRLLLRGKNASGEVNYEPGDATTTPKLRMSLDHLAIEKNAVDIIDSQQAMLDPKKFPDMEIGINALSWGSKKVGDFELIANRTENGFEASKIALTSEALVCAGTMGWYRQGDLQHTVLDVKITDGDLGKVLKHFGDSDAIHGGKLSGELDFAWIGSPKDFDIERIEGELYLETDKGSIEALEEGAGKLLHLVSLNSLRRRLSLDFSDLYKEGFSFDSIKGRFVLMDGDAFTDDFTIEGHSAEIVITGRTGLVTQDYDQIVRVTPELSSSLPVVGVLAGGPVVGAVVLIAERLIGDQLNKLGRVRYQVSGSWEDPVYEKIEKKKAKAQYDTDFEDDWFE